MVASEEGAGHKVEVPFPLHVPFLRSQDISSHACKTISPCAAVGIGEWQIQDCHPAQFAFTESTVAPQPRSPGGTTTGRTGHCPSPGSSAEKGRLRVTRPACLLPCQLWDSRGHRDGGAAACIKYGFQIPAQPLASVWPGASHWDPCGAGHWQHLLPCGSPRLRIHRSLKAQGPVPATQ